ncbi:MAG TPA: hypothetical protein VMU36_06035 [Spirochaetia bacterium]|nr:hypothetical protein [Spirochaetia bacterium]
MDWARKRKTEVENQLRAAYAVLIRERRLRTRIKEMLDLAARQNFVAGDSGSTSSFLKWFSQVGALNIAEIKKKAEDGRWVRRFTQPTTREMGNPLLQDPNAVMQLVKKELEDYSSFIGHRIRDLQNQITGYREKIHSFDVEEEIRTYGRESVRLTKLNIAMSITIPIATFLAGLVASLLMEAARPEILHWIRALLNLR